MPNTAKQQTKTSKFLNMINSPFPDNLSAIWVTKASVKPPLAKTRRIHLLFLSGKSLKNRKKLKAIIEAGLGRLTTLGN